MFILHSDFMIDYMHGSNNLNRVCTWNFIHNFSFKINPSNSKRKKADVFFRNDQLKYNLSRYNC